MWVWQFLYLVDTGGTDGSWEEECYIVKISTILKALKQMA